MSHLSPQPFASVEMCIIATSYCCIFVQGPVFCFLFFVFCFSFPCQAYEAGCGRDNCCPLDVEAGRLTISRDPCPIAVFHSDSKKKWLWQKHRDLSVYLALSLKPCSPEIRWLASLPLFLSPPFECQPQASQSQKKPLHACRCCNGIGRLTTHGTKNARLTTHPQFGIENEGFKLVDGAT